MVRPKPKHRTNDQVFKITCCYGHKRDDNIIQHIHSTANRQHRAHFAAHIEQGFMKNHAQYIIYAHFVGLKVQEYD